LKNQQGRGARRGFDHVVPTTSTTGRRSLRGRTRRGGAYEGEAALDAALDVRLTRLEHATVSDDDELGRWQRLSNVANTGRARTASSVRLFAVRTEGTRLAGSKEQTMQKEARRGCV
jgi:hypothetical protein